MTVSLEIMASSIYFIYQNTSYIYFVCGFHKLFHFPNIFIVNYVALWNKKICKEKKNTCSSRIVGKFKLVSSTTEIIIYTRASPGPLLIEWWASVADVGPPSNQHWINTSYFLRFEMIGIVGRLVNLSVPGCMSPGHLWFVSWQKLTRIESVKLSLSKSATRVLDISLQVPITTIYK